MGCDIHAAIEWKDADGWHCLMHPNENAGKWKGEGPTTACLNLDRDYELFAILANVRNSHGFAGCDTGDQFQSITSNRGLPKDATTEAVESGCTGDHSETWVSLFELLNYDWEQIATRRGVVDARQFEKWDRMKRWNPQPAEYCGGRSGPGIVNLSEDELRKYVNEIIGDTSGQGYVEAKERLSDRYQTSITWQKTYASCAKQLWTKILPAMLKLGTQHGFENVRLLMNFDS